MTHISFRLHEDLVDALAAEAKRLDVTRSDVAREALEQRLGFGGVRGDNGDRQRDADHATPPDISDAVAALKQSEGKERVRHSGMMTANPGPLKSGVAEQRRRALMRARLKNR
jgi:hypothetical protein